MSCPKGRPPLNRPYSSSHPLYRTWSSMIYRCSNENHQQYYDYGGRGIKVCWIWIRSFEQFVKDMGPKPTAFHTLDRIYNDGNYEPLNCRWATRHEQNKRSCRS